MYIKENNLALQEMEVAASSLQGLYRPLSFHASSILQVGYFLALVVDQLTGVGLLDQQNSFLGKLLLHVTVFGVLLLRTTQDFDKYKGLLDEATFYDKQWNASWEGVQRPSETEQQ